MPRGGVYRFRVIEVVQAQLEPLFARSDSVEVSRIFFLADGHNLYVLKDYLMLEPTFLETDRFFDFPIRQFAAFRHDH